MAVGTIQKVRVICTLDKQQSINLFFYRQTFEAGAGITIAEFATGMDLVFQPVYKDVLSAVALYRGVGVQHIFPLPVELEVFSLANGTNGGVAGDPMSPQTAGLFHRKDGLAGRAHRATTYVPFPGEADNSATARPTTTAITGYTARLATLALAATITQTIVGAGGSGTFQPVIWHAASSTFDAITSAQARTVWSQQKRRSFVRRDDAAL